EIRVTNLKDVDTNFILNKSARPIFFTVDFK
ncbi:hypothetical protein TNCT_490531, partial [Trichonephila clavata]